MIGELHKQRFISFRICSENISFKKRRFCNLLPWTRYLLAPPCNRTRTDPGTTRIRWISSSHPANARKIRLMTPLCSPIEFVRRKDHPPASLRAPVSPLIVQPAREKSVRIKYISANRGVSFRFVSSQR